MTDLILEATPELAAAIDRPRNSCAALGLDFDKVMAGLLQVAASTIESRLALRGVLKS